MRQKDKKESKRPADEHAWQAGQDTVDASDGSWISMAVVAKGGDAGIGGDHDCERPPALRGITAQEHCEEIKRKHGPCTFRRRRRQIYTYLKMLRTAIRQTVSDKYPAYLPSAFKLERIFIFSKS